MELVSGEQMDFKKLNDIKAGKYTSKEINEKYVKGETRIVTESARYPLPSIVTMVESDNYELNPDFQRRHRWNVGRKSRLIESFIMNVPVPPIFLYEESFSFYEVMDGLQRLTAIYDFYSDKYALEGLEEWKEINGLTYSQLPDQIKKGIDRRYLSSIILLQETAKSKEEASRMKQLVFERLNSGGIELKPQETRNALYDGPLNQLCLKLARNKYLCRMWGIPEEDIGEELLENNYYREMEDVELVLRFFAFRQIDNFELSSLKEYLDFYLRKGNQIFNHDILNVLEEQFNETVELVYDVLGDKAFFLWRRRREQWNWFKKPTKVLYDPIMHVFCENLSIKGEILSAKSTIYENITNFYEEYYDDFEGRNTNRNNVLKRIELFRKFLNDCLGDKHES